MGWVKGQWRYTGKESWAHQSNRRCEEDGHQGCDERVWGFVYSEHDCPAYVDAELLEAGHEIFAGQGECCGGDEYIVSQVNDRWYALCQACGDSHRIQRFRGCEVEY